MRFRITRVSAYDKKPCQEAEPELRQFHNVSGETWTEKQWFIDIETLEQLLALGKEQGYPLIVDAYEPAIQIYDDYLE